MAEELRNTGIEIIGNIPWSTHLCQFYQSKKDLLDILVPYFKAGLENNEFCIWITSDPLSELEARQALDNQIADVARYFERGQIEILPHSKWYLESGSFDMQKVLDAWVEKLNQGLARGFEGLRATGNAAWLEKKQWSNFAEYEKIINRVLAHRKMLVICTYGLNKCSALEIIDVVRNHEYALVKQGKQWELIENYVHKQAKKEVSQLRLTNEKASIITASFRNVITSNADGMLIVNKTGIIRLANPAAEKLLGCPASELINTRFKYALNADKQSEIEVVLHNSEKRTADMSIVETQWEGEACYLVTLRDVTQSKTVREALRQNKSQLENLINAMSEGVTLIDINGRVIKANPAMCHITKKKLSALEGKLYYDLGNRLFNLDYITLKKEELPVSIVLKTGKAVYNFEIGLERSDGSIVWLRVNAVPLIDESGNLEGVVRTFHDITEQKRMEDSLRKNEAHLRLMLDQMPCILWTTDSQLIVTLSLGAGLQTFNLSSNQIVGMSLYDYFNTSDPDFYPILAHRKALAGEASSYELYWKGKILYCYVEPLKDSNNKLIGVIGIGFDITGKKQAEEALRALSRRLVDVQENERRNIARELHDEIGQSLAALKLMMTQVTRSGTDFCPSSLVEAQTVVTDLIRQVRDMSLRLRPSMLDDLGLLPTLLWHIERYELQTNIKVIFEHCGLLRNFSPEINTAIYRVVQEALTNVARHANAKEVNITIWADENNITLKIEDHGRGFTTSALYSSSSTGISGMRERVLLLGGKLNIETIPGSGTCLEAEIPLN